MIEMKINHMAVPEQTCCSQPLQPSIHLDEITVGSVPVNEPPADHSSSLKLSPVALDVINSETNRESSAETKTRGHRPTRPSRQV